MEKLLNFLKKESDIVLSVVLTLLCIFVGGGVLMAEVAVVAATDGATAQPGNEGLATQVPGAATTVSNAADAGGGGGDGLIQPDIDDQIFMIGTDETVLDGIMRKAKRKIRATGYEVDHYLIDEKKAFCRTTSAYADASAEQAVLPVSSGDAKMFQECGTVLVRGVNGYSKDGDVEIEGRDLMLYVVGKSDAGLPIVRAINGRKENKSDEFCIVPTIPAGTKLIFLVNACAETQKEVAPSIVIPTPQTVYLQKMILNQIVSDYFDSQKKRIPFASATVAEAIVKQFRRECNRTLWVGQPSKFRVDRGKMGTQLVYTTEGIRWQFKRQYDHTGAWTFADIIALSKLKHTGQNCSTEALWLCGKGLLEQIQNIDFTKHKDITMTQSEVFGFKVTKLVTVFGTFYLKHEPTLDYLDYENSGGIIDLEGLVRYYIKNEEGSEEKIEGEEAKRKCIISINALALKGTSHIWVNGDAENATSGSQVIVSWDNATATPGDPSDGDIILLSVACSAIDGSKAGELYQYNNGAWTKYSGEIVAKSE